jgi:hypothetical protein
MENTGGVKAPQSPSVSLLCSSVPFGVVCAHYTKLGRLSISEGETKWGSTWGNLQGALDPDVLVIRVLRSESCAQPECSHARHNDSSRVSKNSETPNLKCENCTI